MKRNYEGIIVLNLQGKEESLDDQIGGIGKELEAEGATLQQVERMGRKEFAYPNKNKLTHGYYVHYLFEAEPDAIGKMRTRLALNEDVQLQHYQTK
ncbi:MAG: 30S ribosomal protein S6 [Verrucomicrobiae bacterium]|nr:30S ribosomal protein S6 [Verrucomicrobiae bacterium]MCP5539107.1 30S ribosomal protein S6 [Akkermansiaceae bacterium]